MVFLKRIAKVQKNLISKANKQFILLMP